MENKLLAALLAVAVLAGCSARSSGSSRVLKPEGETVTVETERGFPLTGEFLGVRGAGFVMLREGRLLELPLAGLSKVKVKGYRKIGIERRELLLHARYPRGLDEAQWDELLRERGQAAFDTGPATDIPVEHWSR